MLSFHKSMNMLHWSTIVDFATKGNPTPSRRIEKSEAEWQEILSPDQFYVTRKHGTEPRFSGEHCRSYDAGKYACSCCDEPLFDSGEKFDSQTGWPSFTQPVDVAAIKYIKDVSHGMVRVEVLCNVCDAHLGHVFPDGPDPSGLRYCINSLSLTKI
jgi:peptide-methionine (R)-S-oxide reductase